MFDRNKVSLDFPGSLFGPSVSLLIKTTKIVGDVIQVSPPALPPCALGEACGYLFYQ